MDAAAAEALYEADRNGVRQITGEIRDSKGGRCAVGVLQDALGLLPVMRLNDSTSGPCPLCGVLPTEGKTYGENGLVLIAHLNDDHGLTFSEIARKLGPDSI